MENDFTVTGSRGDADEAGDHALDSADDGGLGEHEHVEAEPHKKTCRRTEMRVQNGDRGVDVG